MTSKQYEELCRHFLSVQRNIPLDDVKSIHIQNPKRGDLPSYKHQVDLSSTADANKLIADVYAIRADFVRDHPDVVEGLVAGIFEGIDAVKSMRSRRMNVSPLSR